jgi:hypothetical protein
MLGKYYNNALLVVESTGIGVGVIENMTKVIEYPNLYRSMLINKIDPNDIFQSQWGWNTSAQTRPVLMNQLHSILATGDPFTQDKALVDELRTMQIDAQGVPRAIGKDKDDRVLALALALQGRFEQLNGTLTEVDGQAERWARLSPDDQHFYDMVKKRHERLNNGMDSSGRFRGRDGGGFREPRVR